MNNVIESAKAAQISASGNICSGRGRLAGIFVSAAASVPTITIYDEAATGTTKKLVDTFTPVAGQFYKLPFKFTTGCNIVLGGTVSATVGYENG